MSEKPDDIPQDIWDAAVKVELNLPGRTRGSVGDVPNQSVVRPIALAILAERGRAIAACEAQKSVFASDEYATPQPLGGLMERFACDQCIERIREPRP